MSVTHSPSNVIEPGWIGEVLHFWFDELDAAQWFRKSDSTDARIRDRFLALHGWIAADHNCAAATPRSLLAAVIVLDQFSRNLFRCTPRAFAADPSARHLSRTAVARRFDDTMSARERLFLYMPFEHSEDPTDQALAVELIARIGNEEWTRDAVAHKKIIDQFGRFPHRNAVLNRISSHEEIACLQQPNAWWL
jgi:uncharacterized protein (DUF924 family)